jgi:hypothetical protein
MREKIIIQVYIKIYILQVLLNAVTDRNEATVVYGKRFLYACIKGVFCR